MKKLQYLILILTLNAPVWAQNLIPIGQWRSHFNYKDTRLLTLTNDRIYCATDNALFYIDFEDNSINRLSKIDGLSDVGISAMGFVASSNTLIAGYENGNIDLISENEIVNLTQILRAELTTSKRINHISVRGQDAYLSTDFGMVVFDLAKQEVKESYLNLGPSGEQTAVRQSAFAGDSIFLATGFGLIAGNLSGNDNLLDFQNWKRIDQSVSIAKESTHFVGASGSVLIAISASQVAFQRINYQWKRLNIKIDGSVKSMEVGTKALLLSLSKELLSYDLESGIATKIPYAAQTQPSATVVNSSGIRWIADTKLGLIRQVNNTFTSIDIGGLASNQVSKVYFFQGASYILHGTLKNETIIPANLEAYSVFRDGEWTVASTKDAGFGQIFELTANKEQGLKMVSFGDGLLDISTGAVTTAESNDSPFTADGTDRQTLLTGADFDSQGNLWVANYGSTKPLHRRDPQGNWSSFSFKGQETRFPIGLRINSFDDIWMRLDPNNGGGILVFNNGTGEERRLSTAESAGNLPGSHVTEVVFDREDLVWVGTEKGICYFNNLKEFFTNSDVKAVIPVFENQLLLKNEYITAIAVDGGNRKWIGTLNGVWLFNSFGDKLIANYTTENAPLPDNTILDVEVDPLNGEVFIATSRGLVSIRGTATEGQQEHRNVKIFPNPVLPGFTGSIGISGLAQDANIKITDMAGRLVKELQAAGGTAVWDARDFRGNRASAGIYLVFSSSMEGDETYMGKIAVIR